MRVMKEFWKNYLPFNFEIFQWISRKIWKKFAENLRRNSKSFRNFKKIVRYFSRILNIKFDGWDWEVFL